MGIREERLNRAAEMPHRSLAGDSRLDARLESEFGRLFLRGKISASEYEAGIRYANIVLLYLASTDAPEPYGTDYVWNIDDDVCLQRKLAMAAVRDVLKRAEIVADRRLSHVVDRVAVYEQPICEATELGLLKLGLRALAGN